MMMMSALMVFLMMTMTMTIDDDNTDGNVEVSILKATTHNGVKFMKDMLIKVSQEDADKLVSEKKAKYIK